MHKLVLAAAVASASLTLAACSGAEEEVVVVEGEAEAGAEMQPAATEPAMAETGAVLDANAASVAELGAVSGVSPETAEAIVAGQPYATVVDLNTRLRETLSEEEAANVLTNVFVPVNLNSASREEIQLIPGMTDRMVREFFEYRPYEGMEEFDREIGKYVDEAEVARFRRYVTL